MMARRPGWIVRLRRERAEGLTDQFWYSGRRARTSTGNDQITVDGAKRFKSETEAQTAAKAAIQKDPTLSAEILFG